MICSNCGTQNEPGTRFCDECGAALSAACPNCGATNRPSAKFCATCGTALGEEQPRSLSRPESATSERRLVSVLFVDLVGFTPFAEERDPELVRETLDRYFSLARLAIERHGGTIEKFIGDAVMAVWGTPTAHEDDAERAVRAAFELVDSVGSLGREISARAGIMTGDAAVTIGAEGQGMVAGDLVNTASRLQSVAGAGWVLVDESTMRATQASITFEPIGAQELKGKAVPVEAYRAVRVVANRGGGSRSEGLEAPFVGRDEELRQLKDMLHTTSRDPRVRLVSITGPAGIGKSRLTWEFEKYVDGLVETIFWHRGRSPAYGEGVTFWALGEMVRRRAQLSETDDEVATRSAVRATVEEFIDDQDERVWVERALLALLGVDAAPPGGRDALFAAWRVFFERIAARGTTALVFEDLHWADDGLLDFIEHVLEWSKNLPLIVITLSRPELFERRPGWGSGHRFMTALGLEPLTDEKMRELLAGLVPGLPEKTVGEILRRADGIPLYAVEIVRMLVSDGKLELVDGSYRPLGELGDLAVPETLRSLIASRLDALEQEDRNLLQVAAVLGQRFTLAALAGVTGGDTAELEPRIRGLARREFLDLEMDARSPDRGQYGFVQSLIREVAYGTLARRDRRTRHLAAARFYEMLGDEELAGALATHYLAAFEASADGPEKDAVGVQARLALRAAAERAASLGSHQQAVAFVEQALAVTADPSERAALLEIAAESANAGADVRAGEFARDAVSARLATGDAQLVLTSNAMLGRILIDLGRLDEAIEVLEAAVKGAPPGSDDAASATALATLSRAYMRSGRATDSIAVADRALVTAEHQNLDLIVAEALTNKGSSLGGVGRRREARALLREAVAMAHAAGMLETELRARNNLSVAEYDEDPKRALATVLEGIEIGRRTGQRAIMNWQSGSAAMYSMVIGEEWVGSLTRLDDVLASNPQPHDRARALALKALFLEYRGDGDDVLAEAIEAAKGITEPQVPGTIEWALAYKAFRTGELEDAYVRGLRAAEYWHKWVPSTCILSVRAALATGERDKALKAISMVEANPESGADAEVARLIASAGRSLLEGRDSEAVAYYRRAADLARDAGFHLMQAEAIMDAIVLAPEVSESRAWADEAREIFDRIGARPYLIELERALAADEPAAHARAADPLSEPAPQRG